MKSVRESGDSRGNPSIGLCSWPVPFNSRGISGLKGSHLSVVRWTDSSVNVMLDYKSVIGS